MAPTEVPPGSAGRAGDAEPRRTGAGPVPLRRRLLRRVPVRVRHYWRLLACCLAFLVALSALFGTARVRPYVTSGGGEAAGTVTRNVVGGRDLFDATVPHAMRLTFRNADYQRMLDSLFDEDEKEYLEADLVVDGTTVPSVGIRLKGNSTLMGLTRNGQRRQGGFGGPEGQRGGRPDQGGFPPAGFPRGPGAAQGGFPPAGLPGGPGAAQGGPGAALKAEEPESLPWLIRFDEFVDGRRYQGHREIAVRVAGMVGGPTVLNEALSLNLLAAVGEAAERYAYVGLTVNDRPTTARLVVENPDETFADRIEGTGVLYKGRASGRFTDQGEDPTQYEDDFKQITLKGSQDLQPVIDLIRWVNDAGDEEFDKHLAEHVDVTSFARYVALQNLLLNFDDMAGPGRNYYLWYDRGSRRFTVIGWDYNLTFGGRGDQGPHDSTTMGGGGFPGGGQGAPGGGQGAPGGGQGAPGGGTPGRSGGVGGHKLKERFLASAAFTAVYEDAYRTLYQAIFASGTALASLDGIAKVLVSVGGADRQQVGSATEQLRATIRQRTAGLATNEVITGRR